MGITGFTNFVVLRWWLNVCDRQYVIDDWRAYRLAPPPHGYTWVGVGGDYLMVQISSGMILRVGP